MSETVAFSALQVIYILTLEISWIKYSKLVQFTRKINIKFLKLCSIPVFEDKIVEKWKKRTRSKFKGQGRSARNSNP